MSRLSNLRGDATPLGIAHAALAQAASSDKLVLLNFTGYACTNCHWMKANMFTRPEIAAALNQYVLVELFTDSLDAKAEENQKIQDSKFQTIAIPFYAILDPDEKVIASSAFTNPTMLGRRR